MRVLISGASGMIGSELSHQLTGAGDTVLRLVRRRPRNEREFAWDPATGMIDLHSLEGVDAVVNLSGASLGRLPWTHAYRKELLGSRIRATRTLADAMWSTPTPPAAFLSASAVGYYGDRPGMLLTEDVAKGDGFLANLVAAWEAAARLAPDGTRIVLLRSGLVLGPKGAMRPLAALTKLGLGARIGSGTQTWPWISLDDEVSAIRHLLTSSLSGPVNLVGPQPTTADRLTRSLAEAAHRPYLFVVPERLITLALRDAGQEMLLASQNVSSMRLTDDGFSFRHPRVDQAVARMVPW